jgi:hypothetical protein
MEKTAVLPVPDCDCAMTSRPRTMGRIARRHGLIGQGRHQIDGRIIDINKGLDTCMLDTRTLSLGRGITSNPDNPLRKQQIPVEFSSNKKALSMRPPLQPASSRSQSTNCCSDRAIKSPVSKKCLPSMAVKWKMRFSRSYHARGANTFTTKPRRGRENKHR